MSRRRRIRAAVLGVVALAVVWVVPVFAAGVPVPATKAGKQVSSIGANNLKPSACAAITLTTKVHGTGTFSGTSGADLITGGTGVDSISGLQSSDCILGGAGNDAISGGGGTDVCIGGPGTDTFSGCETQIQ